MSQYTLYTHMCSLEYRREGEGGERREMRRGTDRENLTLQTGREKKKTREVGEKRDLTLRMRRGWDVVSPSPQTL